MAEAHHGPFTPEEATYDLLRRVRSHGGGYKVGIIVFTFLAVAGLIALISLIGGGPEPRSKWGYPAAMMAFLLSTAQAAPLIAFATRLAKGFWAIPLRRVAELYAVAGLVIAPMYIVLVNQLPDWSERQSIWFAPIRGGHWPGSPQVWDSIAVIGLAITGILLLYLASLPDLAAARDAGTGAFAKRFSLGWTGTIRQWLMLNTGLILLGTLYLMIYVFMHVFTVADLAISLVPGWNSSIFAAYHAVSGIQAGVATTLLTLWFLRRSGRLERYIGLDPFWGAAKLLLGTSLLFFYFTWSEFIKTWYGRLPEEQYILGLLMFGPYMGFFITSFICNFVAPFLLLIWNPIRVSINGPAFVATIVLIGNLVDRSRIYNAAWSVAGPVGVHGDPAHLPPTIWPDILSLLVMAGAVGAVGLFYLIALRLVPPISLWEYKTGLLLQVERPFGKTQVAVVAKPR